MFMYTSLAAYVIPIFLLMYSNLGNIRFSIHVLYPIIYLLIYFYLIGGHYTLAIIVRASIFCHSRISVFLLPGSSWCCRRWNIWCRVRRGIWGWTWSEYNCAPLFLQSEKPFIFVAILISLNELTSKQANLISAKCC